MENVFRDLIVSERRRVKLVKALFIVEMVICAGGIVGIGLALAGF